MGDAVSTLRDIEDAIALTERQRLMVMRTTDLAVATVLRNSWGDIRKSNAITEMVCRRMFHHYRSQKELKQHIGLAIIPSASGVFQQVVGTYLRAYLDTVGEYQVHLDWLYDGDLRPDIAVEVAGRRHAVIEVKTDLGWRRDYVSSGSWARRQKQCQTAGFARVHLLVLSNLNWPGIESCESASNVRVILSGHPNNRKSFKWYQDESLPLVSDDIIHPIEPLFEEIAESGAWS